MVHRAIPLKKLPLLVAGDNVTCEGPTLDELRVTALKPRISELSRPDRRGLMKPLAANLTQMVVVSAIVPAHDTLLIDQFCVVAESAGIEPVLVINKSDLADENTLTQARDLMAVYQRVGYETAIINTRSPAGIAPLLTLLQDQTSVLVGQSGVGKILYRQGTATRSRRQNRCYFSGNRYRIPHDHRQFPLRTGQRWRPH